MKKIHYSLYKVYTQYYGDDAEILIAVFTDSGKLDDFKLEIIKKYGSMRSYKTKQESFAYDPKTLEEIGL